MFLQKSEEKLRKTWKGHYEEIKKNQLQFSPLCQE